MNTQQIPAGRPFQSGPPPLLGIEAKSIHTPTGAESIREASGGQAGPDRARARRFALLRGAASILYRPGVAWKGQHRTVGCHRHVQDSSFGVTIRRRVDGTGARFAGLHTCGSIWTCPVCAEKIATQRRDELRLAHGAHTAAGGACYLLTLTFPHDRTMELAWLRDTFAKALQRFKNSRTYKGAMLKFGRIGNVKALEVTYGHHGWHPHVHEVIFARPGAQADLETVGNLKDAWIAACIKAGLADASRIDDMLLHAFDFKAGDFVTDYIAKFGREPAPSSRTISATKDRWGIHSEVTRFTVKVGHTYKQGADYIGLTPFGLLADATENGNDESRALFAAYAEAFEGKRQLTWSPGLKKNLGLQDIEDAEIAAGERERPEEEHCVRLFDDEWKTILQHDRHGARYAVLYVAQKYGADGVHELLHQLRKAPPSSRGDFENMYRTRFH